MNLTLTTAQYQGCAVHFHAVALMKEAGVPGTDKLLLTSTFTCIAQGVAVGICIQHILTYYLWQKKRDHTIVRLGIAFLGLIVLATMAISHVQMVGLIKHYNRFTGVYLLDAWLHNLCSFCFFIIFPPVLLHFTFRAFIMWDKSTIVLLICLAGILPSFILGMTSFGFGLSAPWGFKPLTDEGFQFWEKQAKYLADEMNPLDLASRATLLESTIILCVFVCGGILRHRNGSWQMDNAISKIVFLCGESLLPVVLVSLTLMVGTAMQHKDWGFMLLRVSTQLAPAVYFFALILSLVARERVATILAAEPVRALNAMPNHMKQSSAQLALHTISPTIDGGQRFDIPATINWKTLTAEPLTSSFVTPDFVDMSLLPGGIRSHEHGYRGEGQGNSPYASSSQNVNSRRFGRSHTLPEGGGRDIAYLPTLDGRDGPAGAAENGVEDEEARMGMGGERSEDIPRSKSAASSLMASRPGIAQGERRRSSAMSVTIHEILRRGPAMASESSSRHRRASSRS